MEFTKGQRVKVELRGEIVDIHGKSELTYVVKTGSGNVWVYPNTAPTITMLDPENWPPQVGDIWEADGREYYVRWNGSTKRPAVASFDNTDTYWYAEGLEGFRKLSPVLMRRRGQ
jgi:hypothetical protein